MNKVDKQNFRYCQGIFTIAIADTLSAFDDVTVGSKVLLPDLAEKNEFFSAIQTAITAHDCAQDRVSGQMLLPLLPRVNALISAGVGERSERPEDYVLRSHRGRVNAYLRRERATKTASVSVVVYTRDAYLVDPDITHDEWERVVKLESSHVLVAVLATAGPRAVLTPHRFIANLAGGNKEAQVWDGDEIRARAKTVLECDENWVVVAD